MPGYPTSGSSGNQNLRSTVKACGLRSAHDPFADRTFTNQIVIPNPFGLSPFESQTTRVYSGSREFVLGPMLEVYLPLGLAVEADALYRPMNAKSQSQTLLLLGSLTGPVFSNKIDTWEFPVLAKYRLPVLAIKPYIEAGPSFRTVGASLAGKISGTGVAAGIGLDMRAGPLRIAPEVRYTYWGSDGNYSSVYHAVSFQNQLEFLVGLSAAPRGSSGKYHMNSGWTKYLSMGVRGGLPFSNTINGGEFGRVTYTPSSCGDFTPTNCSSSQATVQTYTAARDYLVGPSVEIHLPLRIAVEADGLYGAVNAVVPSGTGLAGFLLGAPSFPNHSFRSWQFPVVLKYKLRAPIVAPYLDAGPTIRTLSSPLNGYLSSLGLTAGVGAEIPAWKVRIAPEVRFVHWGNDSSNTPIFYGSRRNQAQFLVGFVY
jgi:hypothetical protein